MKKYFKKCLVSLFAVCFIFSGLSSVSFAEITSIDGVTYEFNKTDKGAILYRVTSDRNITELELPKQLDGQLINNIMGYRNEDGLFGTFQSLTNLEEVIIPDGVSIIGTHAFRNCTNLKFVTVPESVKVVEMCAFMNCSRLETIYLPKSVDRVKYGAFAGCTSLKNVSAGFGATFDVGAIDDGVQISWY